jgi:hypothetical protein
MLQPALARAAATAKNESPRMYLRAGFSDP